jgi:lia operon protein LiaG
MFVFRRSTACPGALSLLALLAGLPLSATAQGVEQRTLSGDVVAIYNIAGAIRLEAGTGRDVAVQVTPRGADAARLSIATGNIRGRETLRVIYPERTILFRDADRSHDSEVRLSVDDDGTFDHHGGDFRAGRVRIVSSGSGLDANADVRVQVPAGKRVEVHLGVGDATATNVDGEISISVYAARVTTKGTRGRLTLDTGSGEVNVSDVQGDLTLDSGSGSVTLATVKGDELRIDSGSGSVQATGIDVATLSLDSGSGRTVLRAVRARDLSLDSGSGSVRLELLGDVDRLKVDAGSGGVTIGIPESLGAEVSIETGSGGIEVDVPMSVTRKGRDYLRGSIGDGRGRITVESGSGGVALRRSPF